MARKFSQFRVNNKGKDRFKQTPASALLMKRLNGGSDNNTSNQGGYEVVNRTTLAIPASCRVSGSTLIGVNGTVTNTTLILE